MSLQYLINQHSSEQFCSFSKVPSYNRYRYTGYWMPDCICFFLFNFYIEFEIEIESVSRYWYCSYCHHSYDWWLFHCHLLLFLHLLLLLHFLSLLHLLQLVLLLLLLLHTLYGPASRYLSVCNSRLDNWRISREDNQMIPESRNIQTFSPVGLSCR